MESSNKQAALRTPPEALSDRRSQIDPFDWYARMRQENPVRYDADRGRWDVFSYEAVTRVVRDHEAFTSDIASTDIHPRDVDLDSDRGRAPSMIRADPPEHERLRTFANPSFRPGSLDAHRPRFEAIAESLLDEIDEGQRVDIVEAFTHPFPVTVIAELLDLPHDDRTQFIEWSDAIVDRPRKDDGEAIEASQSNRRKARDEMRAYFSELLEERTDSDREDLVSLVAARSELTHDEKVGFCVLLLVAGNVTTINLITNALWCFEENDLFEAVRTGEVDRTRAIEEVLRYRSPVQSLRRVTTEPVELGGERIDAGELIIAWNGSANRDPAVFDSPDEFRPERQQNRHIAFGGGVHVCLGAPLARLEADIALEALLDRFDTIEPDVSDLQPQSAFHGLRSLPCRLESTR